jgi:hypothetical protein
MHELLTDAEKEKMTAAGEEFYTEYFAEGENDGDFHADTGAPPRPNPPPLRCSIPSPTPPPPLIRVRRRRQRHL